MCQRDEESRTRLLPFGEVLDLRGGVQREGLDFLAKLNTEHLRDHQGESELDARIQNFELAARMQLSAGDALDLFRRLLHRGEPVHAHLDEVHALAEQAGSQLRPAADPIGCRLASRDCALCSLDHSSFESGMGVGDDQVHPS